MSRGILYVMTTVVPGLVKIGKTGSGNFEQRMYGLERNVYFNVVGLKRRDLKTGKRVNDYTTLVYNDNLTYADITERDNDYKVNGRSSLEWMVDRYQVKTDKATGIVNDPNEYSGDSTYICNLVPRLVAVSMRTLEIIESLPPIREIAKPADWPAAWKAEA